MMMRRQSIYFILAAILVTGGLNAAGLFPAFMPRRTETVFANTASGSTPVLGSTDYINGIRELANKSGSQAALNRVMHDVDKYGYELDRGDYQNNLRLYKTVSYLISRIGHVDIKTHYFRNKLNRAPKTLKEMLVLNSKLPSTQRWLLLAVKNSVYHIQGQDGIYNLKFIAHDGFCEAVYNKAGVLLTEKNDPINMGTFNYGAGIPGLQSHQKYDIDPYLKWGNSQNSPQKGQARIMEGVKQAMKEYEAHSTSVEAYRANLLKASSLVS